jgi:hypothetical protein
MPNSFETSLINDGHTVHVGWAIKLSGVTSGGVGGGGNYGGGIQSN